MAAALAGGGWAQTQIDLRTQAKSVNFSAASFTMPSQTGPVLPATCQVGATFILTSTLAGQNWYICTSANQWTVQATTLPGQAGNSGSVLSTNGTSLSWSALGGDVSGAPASVSVNKLLGRKLNTVAPTTGQLLGWDGSQWTAQTLTVTIPVTSVFGRTGAVTGQTGDYSFAQISGSASSGQLPSAGGDLSGAITSATVTRVQSRPVSSTAPTTGQVLAWNGTQWAPQNVAGGGAVTSVFGRTWSRRRAKSEIMPPLKLLTRSISRNRLPICRSAANLLCKRQWRRNPGCTRSASEHSALRRCRGRFGRFQSHQGL